MHIYFVIRNGQEKRVSLKKREWKIIASDRIIGLTGEQEREK
jgi:hypothetical protein